MKTIEINVYKFEELNKKAQQIAINNNRNINTRYDWFTDELEYWKDQLSLKGFENAEIYFSGFYSQGDGASFDATININSFIETVNDKRVANLIEFGLLDSITIEKNNYSYHYSHEKTRYTDFNSCGKNNIDEVLNLLCSKIENKRLQFCKEIYKSLENLSDSLESDEAISETLIINEYEFLENGERF